MEHYTMQVTLTQQQEDAINNTAKTHKQLLKLKEKYVVG